MRFASDLVRFEDADRPIVEHLLGRTVVVDDLAVASELQTAGPAGHRYVTHAGEVVEPDGTIKAGAVLKRLSTAQFGRPGVPSGAPPPDSESQALAPMAPSWK